MSLVDKLFGKKTVFVGKKEEMNKTPKAVEKKAPKVAAKKTIHPVTAVKKIIPTSPQKTVAVNTEAKAKEKGNVSNLAIHHITEKATGLQPFGQYIFEVLGTANKIDVAREISGVYKVRVVSVNFINMPGKERRVGGKVGFRSGYKKAIVKLAKGQTIEIK